MRVNNNAGAASYQSPKLSLDLSAIPIVQFVRLWEAPGDFPIEICRHSPVDGLSYWRIKRLHDWQDVEDFLKREPAAYLLSYRWDDQLRWRILWDDRDVLARVRRPPQSRVDWAVADRLDARAAARRGGVVSKMRRKPDYRGAQKLTDRSDYMWLIANLMRERGCNANEIASVLWNSEMSKDRRRADRTDYHERRHIEGEVRRLMEKNR
jgi:hypothetical protein